MTEPFDRFVERCLDDPTSYPWYHHRVAALAEAFGEDSVIVRPFERAQLRAGDAIDDVLSVIGYAPTGDFVRPPWRNLSLSTELVEVIRVLVGALPEGVSERERLRLSRHLRASGRPPGIDPRRYARLSSPARRALVERFEADNARVARRFLGRADGRLFTAPVRTERPLWPGVSPEALARGGLLAWAGCAAEATPGEPGARC